MLDFFEIIAYNVIDSYVKERALRAFSPASTERGCGFLFVFLQRTIQKPPEWAAFLFFVLAFDGGVSSKARAGGLPVARLVVIPFHIQTLSLRLAVLVHFRAAEKSVNRSFSRPKSAIRAPSCALHNRQSSHISFPLPIQWAVFPRLLSLS